MANNSQDHVTTPMEMTIDEARKRAKALQSIHGEELSQPNISSVDLRTALANTPAQPERFRRRREQQRLKGLAQASKATIPEEELLLPPRNTQQVLPGDQLYPAAIGVLETENLMEASMLNVFLPFLATPISRVLALTMSRSGISRR
jgi:hypothetical protein